MKLFVYSQAARDIGLNRFVLFITEAGKRSAWKATLTPHGIMVGTVGKPSTDEAALRRAIIAAEKRGMTPSPMLSEDYYREVTLEWAIGACVQGELL